MPYTQLTEQQIFKEISETIVTSETDVATTILYTMKKYLTRNDILELLDITREQYYYRKHGSKILINKLFTYYLNLKERFGESK